MLFIAYQTLVAAVLTSDEVPKLRWLAGKMVMGIKRPAID
jgi:hypothetical protein